MINFWVIMKCLCYYASLDFNSIRSQKQNFYSNCFLILNVLLVFRFVKIKECCDQIKVIFPKTRTAINLRIWSRRAFYWYKYFHIIHRNNIILILILIERKDVFFSRKMHLLSGYSLIKCFSKINRF